MGKDLFRFLGSRTTRPRLPTLYTQNHHDGRYNHGLETQLPPHHNTQYSTGTILTHRPPPRHLISVTSTVYSQLTGP
jgi:hypothetical protein